MRTAHTLIIVALTLVAAARSAFAVGISDYFAPGLQRSLAEAAARGRVAEVDKLLTGGAQADFQGTEGMTALIWAFLHQNKEGYQHLLERGANPNLVMTLSTLTSDGITDGCSAVSLAARHEDPWYLDQVLSHGGNPNLANPVKGRTPVFECIMLLNRRRPRPRLEHLKLLIAAGANLNARDRNDITPLMYAVRLNRYDLAYVLLQAGADPTQKTKWGTTVVYEIRATPGEPTSELAEWKTKTLALLKEKGIDLERRE